jgi:hypothetical protein
LNANLSRLFGTPAEIRILKAAEIAFREQRLSLTFSTNSPDIFLMDSRTTPTGTVVTVFHTDLTFALRAAASGGAVNDLQPVADDSKAASQFRELLMTWDRHLPRMLEQQRK